METKTVSFELGRTLATPGALAALEENNFPAAFFLHLHARGNWGTLSDADKAMNDAALLDGSRILSAYHLSDGRKIWIITEAQDDDGVRARTTILLPSEY
jgi:hypothetical protein